MEKMFMKRGRVLVEAKGKKYRTCPGQLLLRADDALYNTLVAYRENSSEWWERLNTCTSIQKIVDYINSCVPEKGVACETNIGKIFMELVLTPTLRNSLC